MYLELRQVTDTGTATNDKKTDRQIDRANAYCTLTGITGRMHTVQCTVQELKGHTCIMHCTHVGKHKIATYACSGQTNVQVDDHLISVLGRMRYYP
jgi:hypothetical protein